MLREKIKHMALATPTIAPCKLIATAKRDFPVEVLQALPSEQTLYNHVRRPLGIKDPKTRDEIMFDDFMTKCRDGTEFLYKESEDPRRILIFTTESNLDVRLFLASTSI